MIIAHRRLKGQLIGWETYGLSFFAILLNPKLAYQRLEKLSLIIKLVICYQLVRGDFINANFVGYNNEAAVSNLFAK